jgi:hypothetical protein
MKASAIFVVASLMQNDSILYFTSRSKIKEFFHMITIFLFFVLLTRRFGNRSSSHELVLGNWASQVTCGHKTQGATKKDEW